MTSTISPLRQFVIDHPEATPKEVALKFKTKLQNVYAVRSALKKKGGIKKKRKKAAKNNKADDLISPKLLYYLVGLADKYGVDAVLECATVLKKLSSFN